MGCDPRKLRAGRSRLGARSAHHRGPQWVAVWNSSARKATKLVPPPTEDDPYMEEAYRLWALKAKQPKATGELF